MTVPQRTRRESYEKANETAVSWARIIYNALREGGQGTAWELSQALRRPVYTIRPRLTELFKSGKIKAVGEKWYDPTQRNETVWDVVDKQGLLF